MSARHDLHDAIFAVHVALDRLEEDNNIERMDYLLDGAEALFRSGPLRFEQLRYCLKTYGHPVPPTELLPLSSLRGPGVAG